MNEEMVEGGKSKIFNVALQREFIRSAHPTTRRLRRYYLEDLS